VKSEDLVEKVIVLMPPNVTSFLQQMNQRWTATFKAYYLWWRMWQLLTKTDGYDKPSVSRFWRC
jgi:hypothetical protein